MVPLPLSELGLQWRMLRVTTLLELREGSQEGQVGRGLRGLRRIRTRAWGGLGLPGL